MVNKMILGACLVATAISLCARPLTTAFQATGAIEVDGALDESAWQGAIAASDFRRFKTDQVAARPSTFRLLYDHEALYLGLECPWPAGSLSSLPASAAAGHDDAAYSDECLELYLQPGSDGDYWHLVFNVDGIRYDGRGMDKSADPDWDVATQRRASGWSAEARIPFASLGLSAPPDDNTRWGLNATRNNRLNNQYSTWSRLKRKFHEPEHFGRLLFRKAGPGVEVGVPRRSGTDITWTMTAHGTGTDELEARVTLRTPAGEATLTASFKGKDRPTAILKAADIWRARTTIWRQADILYDGTPVYQSQPLICAAESLRPPKPASPSPVVLQNESVALTFDRQSGRLLKVANQRSGMQLAFGPDGAAVAELETVRFLNNPRFFRQDDVQTVVPDFHTLKAVSTAKGSFGSRISIQHRIGHGLDLDLTVTVPPVGSETQWDIAVNNRLTTRPSKARVVHRVRYPHLSGLPEDSCGSDPHAVIPALMGQRIPEPALNLGQRSRYPYIGPVTMGWFDYYGSEGGLYFKVSETGNMPQTELILRGDPQRREVDLGIERWALCWPGQRWEPGPCGLAPHTGDWHRAADLYRDWFRGTFTLRQPPDWLREAQGYVMSSGHYEFGQLPRILENAQAMGINYIQLWSEMAGGDISYHAYGFPNPYMGSETDLRRAVRELHRNGGHIGVYLNFNTGDPLLGTFLRQPRLAQKIPPDRPRPALDYMETGWIRQSLMDHTGSYSMWPTSVPGYLDDYWNQCPAAQSWAALYKYWVVDKWAKDYKIDVWYLDSCPVSRGSPCFAFDHGHQAPQPEGQAIADFFAKLRREAPRDFCLMQEYASDRLLQHGTHALGLMWHRPHAHPEVVRYTLPEMILFSGLCNSYAGVGQFYPGESVTRQDAAERVFLIGNRFEFGLSHRPPELANEYNRQLVSLRQTCTSEMNHGDFLDTIGLGPLPERVYARVFRGPRRQRLALTLLDRRHENRESFALTLDPDPIGVRRVRSVSLRTLDGQLVPVDSETDETGSVSIRVPVFEGRPAALLVDIDDKE